MNPLNSHPIKDCQICQSKTLKSLLFLGYVPPVNEMLDVDTKPDAEMRFPLELLHCQECSLVQIGYEVDPKILFPHTYPYLSSTTRILRDNFKDLALEAKTRLKLEDGDQVIDVGANDGTLLKPFKEAGMQVLGIEPSQAAEVARKSGIEMIKDYFGTDVAKQTREKFGQAKVVTAANVFAHIKDVHEVVEAILHLLSEDGVFISESHYLLDLVQTLQYDTIYHEHLRYYSLESLKNLFASHGLEIIHVKRIPTHGGSIRVYAARTGKHSIDPSVALHFAEEKAFGLSDGTVFNSFRNRVIESKLQLVSLISKIKAENKRIYGISAPSRASTLINYVGIDDGLVDAVMEVGNSHKLNKYVPGTRIPVLDEKKLFEDQPEYALLFSWHIASELMEILTKKGFKGKFIIPLPEPKIMTSQPEKLCV